MYIIAVKKSFKDKNVALARHTKKRPRPHDHRQNKQMTVCRLP